MFDYDIVFIGGGLNYAGAIIAAKHGKKVALIEQDLNQLGGACLHKGCIPSKLFLHYASMVYKSHDAILKGSLELDMQALYEKKEKILAAATKRIQKQCSDFELIEAKGRVVAPHTVEVGKKVLKAEYIVMGTGSTPFVPDGIAYNRKDIIVSDDLLNLKELPKRVVVYGVGAIGLEMASFFAAAGVEVTLLDRKESLLKNAHDSIKEAMLKQLQSLGINYLSHHEIVSAKSTKNGVEIAFKDSKLLTTQMLLVATGRAPNVDVVACDAIKVERGIVTNSSFETTLPKHYAIGDCNAKVQLAHAARAEVLHVVNQILGKNPKVLNLEHIVKFIHTLPMSYAAVGKTKSTLQKGGVVFKESVVELKRFTYPHYMDASDGMMISYADESGKILGAEILSPNAEELIATVAMALAGKMSAKEARATILAHPTFSEALEKTFFRL